MTDLDKRIDEIMELGNLLRKHRIDANMTLKAYAEKLGKPASFLSAMERGRKNCSNELLLKIVEVLDLNCGQAVELQNARARVNAARKHCTHCQQLQAQLAERDKLVRKAYGEGHIAGRLSQNKMGEVNHWWHKSKAKKALTKAEAK